MIIIPYIELDGIRTFDDTYIRGLYRQMVEDGTADTVFMDGCITDEEGFLNMFKYGGNNLFVLTEDKRPVGITWLNGCKKNTATAHFCMFKCIWGKNSVDVGKQTIQWLLNLKDETGRYYHDVITGVTPAKNRFAVGYIQKIGMNIVGEIPGLTWIAADGESSPAIISYITRET